MKIATLQAKIRDKVGYESLYKKIWMSKQMDTTKIFGGWKYHTAVYEITWMQFYILSSKIIVIIEYDPH